MTLGSIVWGQAAGQAGLSAALIAAGIGMMATLLLGWRWPIRAADPDKLMPVGMAAASGAMTERSQVDAPLTVMIAHRIPASALPAFLELMRERRRIRLRDGARRWSLLQDAGDPTQWLEQFASRSSGDYLRHRERRTAEDHANAESIRALDANPDGPSVRFLFERQPGTAKPPLTEDWGNDVDAR
jgi:hypothetical protein